jgi:hypothetical protein
MVRVDTISLYDVTPIHEQPLPLPHYCGIGDLHSIASAAQITLQFAACEERNGKPTPHVLASPVSNTTVFTDSCQNGGKNTHQ